MNAKIFNIVRINSSEQTFKYKASIIEEHPIFEGHFPNAAVVPGVCSMYMIKECLQDILKKQLRYSYIKECKFLSAIIPIEHKELDVHISIKQDNSDGINSGKLNLEELNLEELNSKDLSVEAEIIFCERKMMKLKAILG